MNINNSSLLDATKSIKRFLEEKIPKLEEKEITYLLGFLKSKAYEEKLKEYRVNINLTENEKIEEIPFILIRPNELKQSVNSGTTDKNLKVSLRIVIEEEDEEVGYEKVIRLGEKIIDNFTFYPSIKDGFALDTSKIVGYFDYELSAGNYWSYVIELDVTLPVAKPRLLKELGWI